MEDKRAFRGIWIPKEIWLSKDLTLQEKVFIVEIDSLDNEKGCFASNKHFSDFFGLSIGRVSQVINSLKKKGYIDIEYIRENKEIVERIIKINKPPYPIYYSKEGYLENDKNHKIYLNLKEQIKELESKKKEYENIFKKRFRRCTKRND